MEEQEAFTNFVIGVLVVYVLVGVLWLGATVRAHWHSITIVAPTFSATDSRRLRELLHNDKVFECLDNEDKDYKHLVRNLDYYTRPAYSVRILDTQYAVTLGKEGARIVAMDKYNESQRRRLTQIRLCALETAHPDPSFWEDMCHTIQLRRLLPTHDQYTDEIARELVDRDLEPVGEFIIVGAKQRRRKR